MLRIRTCNYNKQSKFNAAQSLEILRNYSCYKGVWTNSKRVTFFLKCGAKSKWKIKSLLKRKDSAKRNSAKRLINGVDQKYGNLGAIYVIFHVGGGDVSLEPHRLIKGRRGGGEGRGWGAGHNGGAISDGNARHVGMRRTPPLLIANDSWYFLLTTLETL